VNTKFLQSYCDFLQLLGHQVIQTASGVWIDVRPHVFQPASPLSLDANHGADAEQIVKMRGVIACRWFSAADPLSPPITDRPRLVLYVAREPYGFPSLQHKARNQTRRGLERVEVRRATLDDELVSVAYPIYAETIRRLGLISNNRRITRRWQTWVKTIRNASCAEFWGAWHDRALVAFSVAVRTPWGLEIVLQRSASNAFGLNPNNALVYTATCDALAGGAEQVSFGLSSFASGGASLDHFKTNMGYQAIRLEEHYGWHPLLRRLGPSLTSHRLRALYRPVVRLRRAVHL
jgi:hypothetical protein